MSDQATASISGPHSMVSIGSGIIGQLHMERVTATSLLIQHSTMGECYIDHCDLTKMRVSSCKIDGMTVDGISITEALAAWRAAQKSK